jgi:membrane carboxypeptidase/penicillin-binding protein
MIKLLNVFLGGLVRTFSILALQFSLQLKSQFIFIKQIVLKSSEQKKIIAELLIHSVIAIEDKRFFQHVGIDIYSIIRAIVKNTTTRRLEGASTIVQQLIRNITNEREIKLKRKIKEIIFATLITEEFSKNEILFAYFNTYKFKDCVGVVEFCQNENYDIKDLTSTQIAEVAARFKYPTLNKTNYIRYLKRVRKIEIISNRTVKGSKKQNESETLTDVANKRIKEDQPLPTLVSAYRNIITASS